MKQFCTIITIIAAALLVTCSSYRVNESEILKYPLKQLKNYSLAMKIAPEKRIFAAPEVVLKSWMKWDKRTDYKSYLPSRAERRKLAFVLKSLPPLHYRVLRKKLIGIYFIQNVLGSGIADWVMGPDRELYYYIVLNPNNLRNNLSQQLTWRASTAFKKNSGTLKIRINTSRDLSGLHYILFHEVTHVVDYERHFTPHVEKETRFIQKGGDGIFAFTRSAWKSFKESRTPFQYRKGIRFYGIGGKAVLNTSDIVKIYRALEKTPFVSLYSTRNWAEDLADFLTFYHITQKLGRPYSIEVYDGSKKVYSYEPMKNPLVKKRFKYMSYFYR